MAKLHFRPYTHPITKDKEENKALRKKKKQFRELEGYREKLMEYDNHLDILGEGNSYSKTDSDATFMRMKEDAIKNSVPVILPIHSMRKVSITMRKRIITFALWDSTWTV